MARQKQIQTHARGARVDNDLVRTPAHAALPSGAGAQAALIEDHPRPRHILVHLRHEIIDRSELFFRANTLDEIELDRFAVEIAVKIQEKALDGSRSVTESRVGSNTARAQISLGPELKQGGVDSIQGKNLGAAGNIRGRKSQIPAASLTGHHPSGNEMKTA